MNKDDIEKLSDKITSGLASDEEILLYNRLCNSLENNNWEWDDNVHGTKPSLETSMKKTIWSKIKFPQKPASIVSILRRYAAAAAVLLVFLSVYFIYNSNRKHPALAKIVTQKQRFKNDVPPGTDKAILTLADGSTILLDDEDNGTLTTQGSTKVLKFNGKVSYQSAHQSSQEILFNTISTPRGGQYQVVLPDGSAVWLNAASSIRFPTAFQGNERKVEVTGEVYFEIAKKTNQPFKVKINLASGQGGEVVVIGTHFNVNAYDDEPEVNTTLFEGSVKVNNAAGTNFIKPGQQLQYNKLKQNKIENNPDMEQVIAWKEGRFQFENADINQVMRQLTRWYDIEVEFKGNITTHFGGTIPRNVNILKVLHLLEATGEVHFNLNDKKITILP